VRTQPRAELAGVFRLLLHRQRLTQPGHGAIKVLQIDVVQIPEGIPAAPAFRSAVASGGEQAMQYRDEYDPFERKPELPPGEQFPENRGDSQFLPQPPEHQRRPDMDRFFGLDLLMPHRVHDSGMVGVLRQRLEQTIELPVLSEHIQPPERGNHPLPHPSVNTFVVYNLEIPIATGLLDSSEHDASLPVFRDTTHLAVISLHTNRNIPHFRNYPQTYGTTPLSRPESVFS